MAKQSPKTIPLLGSARPRPASSQFIRPLESDALVYFSLLIRLPQDAPPVPDFAYWQTTPIRERRMISTREYAEVYGATAEDIGGVTLFLDSNDITIVQRRSATRTISASCTAAKLRDVFKIQLNWYETPLPTLRGRKMRRGKSTRMNGKTRTHTHHGFDGHLHIPEHLSGILTAIIGLDNRQIGARAGGNDPDGAVPLRVCDVARLYNFPNTGAKDQVVGVFSVSGYLESDISAYFANLEPTDSTYSTPPNLVDVGLTFGGTQHTNNNSAISTFTDSIFNDDNCETTFDIQTVATVAQGCTVNVYFTSNDEVGWAAFLDRLLVPHGEMQPTVVTNSYTIVAAFRDADYGPATTPGTPAFILTQKFQFLAGAGVHFFSDTGDWGADDQIKVDSPPRWLSVGYPSSDPWVTAVGGTILSRTSGASPVISKEFAWSDANSSSIFGDLDDDFGSTGGGVSALFEPPDYQAAAGIGDVVDSTNTNHHGRVTPDVAGMVAYTGFIINNLDFTFMGTSFSTPLYAGLFAVLRSSFGIDMGHLTSIIYPLGPTVCNDITVGNNNSREDTAPGGAPFFEASFGFDAVSGWGSIDGTKMQNGMAKLIYPPAFYFIMDKSSFGLDEVGIGGASFSSAFWVALDGFTPNEVPPNSVPTITSPLFTPGSVKVTVGVVNYEKESLPDTPQRILYPCQVTFTAQAAHANNNPGVPGVFPASGQQPIQFEMQAFFNFAGLSKLATGEIELVAGADPYFRNIDQDGTNPPWLSQDLRVFTVIPGFNTTPVTDPSISTAAPILQPASPFVSDTDAGYRYCQNLLSYLDDNFSDPNGTDPFALLPNQTNALNSGDSTVTPSTPSGDAAGDIFTCYNFAVARVRINGATGNDLVRVFFRLFATLSNDTDYNTGTYPTSVDSSGNVSPSVGQDSSTIPFFATGNYETNSDYQVNTDYTAASVNNKSLSSTAEKWYYFGCFINLYPPANKITVSGSQVPVLSLFPGSHHCLVAEISFTGSPIIPINGAPATPHSSDKLAQRNLQVTPSDNPGGPPTHLIPQTFDVRPSMPPGKNTGPLLDRPDELVVDWGNVIPGSRASIYWPQANVSEVIALSKKLYETQQLSLSQTEPDTIECIVSPGFTYIPIPFGTGPSFAGLFSIQLPQGVVRGQEFLLTMRRLSTRQPSAVTVPKNPRVAVKGNQAAIPSPTTGASQKYSTAATATISGSKKHAKHASEAAAKATDLLKIRNTRPTPTITNWRFVTGSFAVKIPVTVPAEILPSERDLQSITAWRLNMTPTTGRWYKVLLRYLAYINARVDGLGGAELPVVASPFGAAGPPSPPIGNPVGTGTGTGMGNPPWPWSWYFWNLYCLVAVLVVVLAVLVAVVFS